MPPLVVAGINIDVDYKAIHRPTKIEKVLIYFQNGKILS
jgi:hypothetical protein